MFVCPPQKGADSWPGWGREGDIGDCSTGGRVPPFDGGEPYPRHHVHGAHSAACKFTHSQSEEAGFLMTLGLLCSGQNECVFKIFFSLWATLTLGYDTMYI